MKRKHHEEESCSDNVLFRMLIIALVLSISVEHDRLQMAMPTARVSESKYIDTFSANKCSCIVTIERNFMNSISCLNLTTVKLKLMNIEEMRESKACCKHIRSNKVCKFVQDCIESCKTVNQSYIYDQTSNTKRENCSFNSMNFNKQNSEFIGKRFFTSKFNLFLWNYGQTFFDLIKVLNNRVLFFVCIYVILAHALACTKMAYIHTENTTHIVNRDDNSKLFRSISYLLSRKQIHVPENVKERTKNRKHWHFIFDFTYSFPTNLTTFPFSLNNYTEDIVKRNISGEPLMKYEWSRYLSFKNFPISSIMRPIKLAQAGFFYTGQGQEVKCFCCGVTNSAWTSDETAVELHRRISPHCRFIRLEDTDNVSIHIPDYYNDVFQTTQSNADSTTSGANGGPGDLTNGIQDNGINMQSNGQRNSISSPTGNRESTTHPNSSDHTQRNTNRGGPGFGDQSGRGTYSRSHDVMGQRDIKHPDYADRSARIASFQNWPCVDIQDPVELADAGLFYAGVNDCVRCYYCGIGLKNWERGDDPWSEHIRWSNSCGHLLQHYCNGDQQSAQPTRSNGHVATAKTVTSHEHSPASLNTNTTRTNLSGEKNGPGASSSVRIPSGSLSSGIHLDSPAARSIIEMGYSKEIITMAIQKYRETNNKDPSNSTEIMEIILESEEDDGARPSTKASNTGANGATQSGKVETNIQSNESKPSTPKSKGKGNKSGKKTQLNGEARSLIAENKALKEQMLCKICMDKDADVVFLPCGHMVSCQACAVSLRKCAVCRDLIKGSVRVFQS